MRIVGLTLTILILLATATVAETAFGAPKKKATAAATKGGKGSATALAPEALSAKALLEDLLARRFAQGLSTIVDKNSYSVGAQLDLVEVIKPQPRPASEAPEPEPISDLMLGTLDPEALLKNFTGPEERLTAQKFLENYKIKAVEVQVGLSETLGTEVRADVEKWLTSRLSSEFGSNGKGTVTSIKVPKPEDKAKAEQIPKTPLDLLGEFQSLAGQAVLALAILMGVILWQLLSPKKSQDINASNDSRNYGQGAGASNTQSEVKTAAAAAEEDKAKRERDEQEREKASVEIGKLTERLNELLPKISRDLEGVMRSWCQMGEPGWIKLASFAEAVGKEMGKLPIPVDALSDVSKVFSKMAEITLSEKRDALQKAYWDLLTVLNLGPAALDRPFGYLGGFNIGMVSQVLMEQNPKMKTVVSLFMPPDLRTKYMQTLSLEAKRELLEAAAGMSEIASDELRGFDGSMKSQLKPTNRKDVVPLEMTLSKLVSSLTPIDEIVLLAELQGPTVDEYQKSTPSLAFLAEWPDEKITILLQPVTPDELVAFCRVRPDLRERMIRLAPPMTAEMATDELSRQDNSSDKDKNLWLERFSARLKRMVQAKELDLDEVFALKSAPGIASGEGNPDGSQRAA